MAKNLDIAKVNYQRGLWTEEMIANLVSKGKLTDADYQEITGEVYSAQSKTKWKSYCWKRTS